MMLKGKHVFILDLDMTLVDSITVFYNTYSRILAKYTGRRIDFEDFYKAFCEDKLDPPMKNPSLFWDEFKKNFYPEDMDDLKLLPGSIELLEKIRGKGHPIIILSGRGTPSTDVVRELEALGISYLVDEVLTLSENSDSDGKKPFDKTDAIRIILKKYPLPCIVIGDYVADMDAGKKNGCHVIGVTTGCKSEKILRESGADIVLPSLKDVIDYLEKTGIL